jgi:DNA (cytosine-5)-methyltransferase 1
LFGDSKKDKGTKKRNTKEVCRHLENDCKPVGVDVYNYTITGDVAATLGANCHSKNSHGPKVLDDKGIRLHTPLECERLQGFPDGYTDISYNTKHLDNIRRIAIGNSMPVPVMKWRGERIDLVDNICRNQ